MSVLLRFYLVSCAFIFGFLLVGVVSRRREVVVRTATLFGLTQLTCLALWLGPSAFVALAAVICVLGSNELLRLFRFRVPSRVGIIAVAGGLFALAYAGRSLVNYAAFPIYVALTVLVFAATPEWRSAPAFAVGFTGAVIGYGAGFLARLGAPAIGAVLSFLLLLQCNDAFGYFVGGVFGRSKVFPVLSPKKSMEGYVGGAFGIAIALLLLIKVIRALPYSGMLPLVILGIASWAIGNLGDLLFSAVKRTLEVKDFGKLLPGHGGILDRFDNILFGSPLFFLAWHLFVH